MRHSMQLQYFVFFIIEKYFTFLRNLGILSQKLIKKKIVKLT